jgi:hypothetical protein
MARYEVPDLRNATLSHLIDEAVKYRKLKAEADFYDKAYSTAIKARLNGKSEHIGENHVALLTVSYATRISPDLCRALLDEEQLKAVSVDTEVVTLRFVQKLPQEEQETVNG